MRNLYKTIITTIACYIGATGILSYSIHRNIENVRENLTKINKITYETTERAKRMDKETEKLEKILNETKEAFSEKQEDDRLMRRAFREHWEN